MVCRNSIGKNAKTSRGLYGGGYANCEKIACFHYFLAKNEEEIIRLVNGLAEVCVVSRHLLCCGFEKPDRQ
jgi:hypothetical protein